MKIISLNTTDFRNLDSLDYYFSDKINIFFGDNAQGKTNLIEAIYIVGTTKSFRTNDNNQLIKFDREAARIECEIVKKETQKKILFEFLKNQKKKISINNKRIDRVSDYIGNLNITLFSPDDLMLLKGDASFRRKFLDLLLCQTDYNYLKELSNYQKILKHRNVVLKEIKIGRRNPFTIDPWNDQLISYATKIVNKRVACIKILSDLAEKAHKQSAFNEYLEIIYVNSVQNEQNYENIFREKQKEIFSKEIEKGNTLIGPHRDDLEIKIDSINARYFASQGQQRTIVISLKLAEIEFIKQVCAEYPILLLDDVFSELDEQRKKFIMEKLMNRNIQIFLTGTNLSDFEPLNSDAKIFHISKNSKW